MPISRLQFYFQQRRSRAATRQKGVTLLLAVLILAAISAVVFSLAAIVYNEVKTSSDLTRTEPIITADEAFAEDGLFKTVRGISGLAQCISPAIGSLNGVTVSTCANYYLDNPDILRLATAGRKDFYIYNPLNQQQSPGYTSISVQMNSGFQSTVYFCNWTASDCPTAFAPDLIDSKTIQSLGGSNTWNSPVLNPSNLYILTIVDSATDPGLYTINSSPQGLPAGTTTIDAEGARQGLTRKLEVSVPQ